jgi:hypothetical protein
MLAISEPDKTGGDGTAGQEDKPCRDQPAVSISWGCEKARLLHLPRRR